MHLYPLNFYEVREIQKNLLKYYEEDFSKHASKEVVPRIMVVWNSIPSQLVKENIHARLALSVCLKQRLNEEESQLLFKAYRHIFKLNEVYIMKTLYYKCEIWFAVVWIIAYCVLASIGDNLSDGIGIQKIITLPILIVLSAILLLFVRKNQLLKKYGLCKSEVPASKMLFYTPLLALLTVNLWYGCSMNTSVIETVLYILSMFCVGFLEEVIFRGFLFCAMAENGVKSAIIVSSVTFGIGHIVNLINGSGAELLPNLLQVIYAIAAGFMFMMIFYKTKSLLPCIITHGVFNALSVFSNEAAITSQRSIISCLFMVLFSGSYALYITFAIKQKNTDTACTVINI